MTGAIEIWYSATVWHASAQAESRSNSHAAAHHHMQYATKHTASVRDAAVSMVAGCGRCFVYTVTKKDMLFAATMRRAAIACPPAALAHAPVAGMHPPRTMASWCCMVGWTVPTSV